MKYRFITCFALEKMNLPRERGDLDLHIDPASHASATLTLEPDRYLDDADRRTAVRNLMIGGAMGATGFARRVEEEVDAIRTSRKNQFGSHLFLVFEGEGEVASFCPSNQRETNECVVCFDGADPKPIRRAFEAAITSVKASLMTMTDGLPRFQQVADAIVFFREDGKPVYSYTLSGSADVSVSRPLSEQQAEKFEERYRRLAAANSASVSKAIRLYEIQPHNWVELYRIYEVIEADIGGLDEITAHGWASKRTIKDFKHTACSPGATGDAARHGKEFTTPPSNPINLGDARKLVEHLIQKWLSSKASPR